VLSKIREKTQGIIATLILAFVAIPFVLWGIGSYFGSSASEPVAKVNGMEISQVTYRQQLDEVQRANPRAGDSAVMKQLVLENLINQTLLVSQAQDSGYRVSDRQLASLIHGIPEFQRDGKFQPGLYEAVLNAQGMRPADFEARLRRQGMVAQLPQGLSETAFVTEAEVDSVLRLLRQERRVSYAIVNPDAFLSKVSVSAKDIEDYYRANQESFRAPEAVRVEYVSLKAADIAKQIEPTEEQLRQAYSAEAARYTTPAKRRISHILISLPSQPKEAEVEAANARAEALLKQIRAGADFATLAKKESNDTASAAKGGDLGEVAPGVLPPELEAAAVALKPGEVSEPIRTSFGFHLLKLTEFTPEQRKPFDAVKQELRDLVRKRRGEERFYEMSERFRNLAYEHPEGLSTLAQTLNLKIQKSDWFTRSGGPGIAQQPRVVSAAFEPDVLSGGRNSDAIDADVETLVALHVVDHRPPAIRPLAEVRSDIESTLKQLRAREQAQAAVQKWAKELEGGKSIAALAHEPGVTLRLAQTLSREQAVKVNPAVVDAVFSAPRPKAKPVVGQVELGPQGLAVFELESVKDGDPASADEALKAKVRDELKQHHGADYYAGYRAGLRKSADVKINAEQL
jgi:peptidyl-prolyl cis-trans isomerase D